jgi:hypothetical protein
MVLQGLPRMVELMTFSILLAQPSWLARLLQAHLMMSKWQ